MNNRTCCCVYISLIKQEVVTDEPGSAGVQKLISFIFHCALQSWGDIPMIPSVHTRQNLRAILKPENHS